MRGALRSGKARAAAIVVGLLTVGGIVGTTALDDAQDAASTGVAEPVEEPDISRSQPRRSGATVSASSSGGMSAGITSAGSSADGAAASTETELMSGQVGGLEPEALGGSQLDDLNPRSAIIKTGTLVVEVEEGGVDAAHQAALRRVSRAGGFVQSSTTTDDGATLTFKVPSEGFEEVVADLRDLGEVGEETVTGEDVSEEFVDIEARLRHWRAQEAAFLVLMQEATSVSETIEVRRELSVIQQEIERLEGRRRFLEDRTSFSQITLELAPPVGAVVAEEPESGTILGRAWDDARETALEILGGTVVVLGAMVPLAGIIGLPLLLLAAIFRRRGDDGGVSAANA